MECVSKMLIVVVVVIKSTQLGLIIASFYIIRKLSTHISF